ncbi:MAG: AAA family ATPase [Archangium sp.]|nr:AAA family ATPase [Archangium sp.]
MRPSFLQGVYVVPEKVKGRSGFPWSLAFLEGFDLRLESRVTIFVGENGCGKSTLLEACAELVGLPWDGGSVNERADSEGEANARLAEVLRPRMAKKPKNKFFFRAENLTDLARLLERRKADPDFMGDPYAMYGGRSIRTRSHGEAVTAVLTSRDGPGIYLMDEPESGLSPARQLALVELISEQADQQDRQFLIATHSPILMSIPGAEIIDMNDPTLPRIARERTVHWHIFKRLLTS